MKCFLVAVFIMFSLSCKGQFLTGATHDPINNKTQLFWFKKQPYGMLALTQRVGGTFTCTNIFFNKKKYGLLVGVTTDTTLTVGVVKNLVVNKNIFQPQISYSTKKALNISLRSDLYINDRWIFVNFTGYNKVFYSKVGFLYKFE